MNDIVLAIIFTLFSWLILLVLGFAVGYKEGLKENSEVNEYPKQAKQ